MNVLVLGAGMMGRAIAYDLDKYSQFDEILLGDRDKQQRISAGQFLKNTHVRLVNLDVNRAATIKQYVKKGDVLISAVPYRYNLTLSSLAIHAQVHFIDLGGNNTIVEKQRGLFTKAKNNKVTVIPDSGLAPGLVSIITHDIVDSFDTIDFVKLRVGGLPRYPQPPLNYQIVFSPYGLINEYVEDAFILDHGKIITKKSMTELETVTFPKPFGRMEAFLTSGGCSTLPMTYQKKIQYLDYKTIRYPGHCGKINTILDVGFASEEKIQCAGQKIAPRDVFASLLEKNIPTSGEDVVLLKALSQGTRQGRKQARDYVLIDYYDKENDITAMMRTTGYPVSITAQMIEDGTLTTHGVFCPEELIPPQLFFKELKKRGIILSIRTRSVPQ